MERTVIFIISFVLSLPVAFYGGYVLSEYWAWFIQPVFTDLPTLTALHGWGIMLFAGLVQPGPGMISAFVYEKLRAQFPSDDDKLQPLVSVFAYALLYTYALIVGFVIYTLFM